MLGKSDIYKICEECFLQPENQEGIIKTFLETHEMKYDSLVWIEFYNSDSIVIKYDLIKKILKDL